MEFVNHGYYVDGTYSTTVTKVHEDETPIQSKAFTSDNASNWENVLVTYNGKTSSSVWLCVKMTYDASASHNGKIWMV